MLGGEGMVVEEVRYWVGGVVEEEVRCWRKGMVEVRC